MNARIQCGNLAHVSDDCRQQHCIQNCDQTAADRGILELVIVLLYPTITIANLHDVPFSYNTCVTDDRQTTDRRHIVPKDRPNCPPKIRD